MKPDVALEVEVEASVAKFTNRLRPRVHRLRPDLAATDLDSWLHLPQC
ncbi:hypothetical protein [Amycolatopsis keratiniphila]|nr:hypothetical protein [Amycolatopsis keratiniphila]